MSDLFAQVASLRIGAQTTESTFAPMESMR